MVSSKITQCRSIHKILLKRYLVDDTESGRRRARLRRLGVRHVIWNRASPPVGGDDRQHVVFGSGFAPSRHSLTCPVRRSTARNDATSRRFFADSRRSEQDGESQSEHEQRDRISARSEPANPAANELADVDDSDSRHATPDLQQEQRGNTVPAVRRSSFRANRKRQPKLPLLFECFRSSDFHQDGWRSTWWPVRTPAADASRPSSQNP